MRLLSLLNPRNANFWLNIAPRYLPFADVATPDLPLRRLLRLALFQFSVGMVTALLIGTLNRVLIVELQVAASLVASMIALPVLVAPLRAFMGHRSDTYRSVLGWKRVPYLWLGSLMLFGGLAIMPFSIILLSQSTGGTRTLGLVAATAAFLMAGFGMHTTQTAGLALATDLAAENKRPRVVALMYVMLLVGLLVSGGVYALLLANFSNTRLVQVIQGTAVMVVFLNLIACWKQEPRRAGMHQVEPERASFANALKNLLGNRRAKRYLMAVFVGSAAFAMQDVILEPYGAQMLGLSVSGTSLLTALTAAGALLAYGLAAFWLGRHADPYRLAAYGMVVGMPAFSLIIFSHPFASPLLYQIGAFLVGVGSGLFAVSTLAAAMSLDEGLSLAGSPNRVARLDDETRQDKTQHDNIEHHKIQHRNFHGLALGAWGAAQATAAGLAMGLGGSLRDVINSQAMAGRFGEVLRNEATGYSFVYHTELLLLVIGVILMGPLVRFVQHDPNRVNKKMGFSDLPA